MLFAPTLDITATTYEYNLVGSIMMQMKEPMEIDEIAEPMDEDDEDEPMMIDESASIDTAENPMELEEEDDIDGTIEMMETDENEMIIDDTMASAGAVHSVELHSTAEHTTNQDSPQEEDDATTNEMELEETQSVNDITNMMAGMSLHILSGNKRQPPVEENIDEPVRHHRHHLRIQSRW